MSLQGYYDYGLLESGDDPNGLNILPIEGNRGGMLLDEDGVRWVWNSSLVTPAWIRIENKVSEVDYSTLRATAGIEYKNSVTVEDFTYIFNAISYTTKGGVFVKDSTGTENGGTVIVASDGTIWRRVWNGISAHPEWWEVGGYGLSGVNYDNYQSGNGVVHDTDRIVSAMNVADVIELQQREYLIHQFIPLLAHKIFNGNFCTLKRIDGIESLVTAVTNDSIVTLDNVAHLRVGMGIFVTDGTATFSGLKGSNRKITDITGNVVTLDGNLTLSPIIGDKVYMDIIIFKSAEGVVSESRDYVFNNIIINGNKANNLHTVAWSVNYTGLMGANTTFNNCEFFNTPTENIIAPDAYFEKCRFKDLTGSAMHVSGKSEYNDDLVGGQVVLYNCVGDGFNQGTQANMDHSEGLVVFSSIPESVKIQNCRFINGTEGIIGNVGSRSDYILIENSRFENFKYICDYAATSVAIVDDIIIKGNTFVQCGRIDLRYGPNDNIQKDLIGYRNIKLIDNEFNNTQCNFYNVVGLDVVNNKFYIQDTDTLPFAVASTDGVVVVSNSDQVRIIGNTFEGFSTYNTDLLSGVVIRMRDTDDFNADVTYHWSTNVRISDNYFTNFHRSIAMDYLVPPIFTVPVRGWNFSNNHVYMLGDVASTSDRYGIQVPPGCISDNDTVITQAIHAGSQTIPILALGIDDTGDTAAHLGAFVKNAVVIGDSFESIRIGGRNTGDNEFNVTIMNCVTTKAIVASGSGTDNLFNNQVLALPVSYVHPVIHSERSDVGSY